MFTNIQTFRNSVTVFIVKEDLRFPRDVLPKALGGSVMERNVQNVLPRVSCRSFRMLHFVPPPHTHTPSQ